MQQLGLRHISERICINRSKRTIKAWCKRLNLVSSQS